MSGEKVVKKIIMGLFLFVAVAMGEDEFPLDNILVLEKNRNYQLAREVMDESINNENKLDAIKIWLDLDRNMSSKLDKNSKITALTKFIPPEEWSTTDYAIVGGTAVVGVAATILTLGAAAPAATAATAAAACVCSSIGTGAVATAALAGGGALVGGVTGVVTVNVINEDGEDPKAYLVNIEVAKKILSQYSILLKSQKDLRKHLNTYVKKDTRTELITLSNQQKKLQDYIEESKQNYLSYTVMSPYLANTDYHIYLSNDDWIGHDFEELKIAAESMAHGSYETTLKQVKEDVRKQWYETFSKLKETATEKELESLEVWQTILDTASNDKNIGKTADTNIR